MRSSMILVIVIVLGLSLLLTACAQSAAQATVVVTEEPAPTQTPTVVAEVTAAATEVVVEADSGDAEGADKPGVDNPKANEVLNQVTLVQHHHNADTGVDTFTCASRGLGVNGVAPDPKGPRYVGPNAGDFDLRGVVGLFEVNPDESVFFVPQQTGGKFLDADGIEQERYTLEEIAAFFASGEAKWIGGRHGDPGRVAECDPQYPRQD